MLTCSLAHLLLPTFLPFLLLCSLVHQMCEVSVGSSAELEKMIELVFEKAINDTNFANLYAEMCVTLENRSRSWYALFLEYTSFITNCTNTPPLFVEYTSFISPTHFFDLPSTPSYPSLSRNLSVPTTRTKIIHLFRILHPSHLIPHIHPSYPIPLPSSAIPHPSFFAHTGRSCSSCK